MRLLTNIKHYFDDIPVQELRSWLVLVVLMAGLQALPEDWRAALRYDRDALPAGEVWRLLSANFVHLGWPHLWLNMGGFLAIGWLFADEVPTPVWAGVLLTCCLTSSLGLYWFTPEVRWVVGLSGALHGLFVFGAVCWIRRGYRAGWGLLLGVIGKLIWEQTMGAMPMSAETVGGPVATDAHLWGALGGLCAGLVYGIWRRRQASL